jgi:hypothetical protein
VRDGAAAFRAELELARGWFEHVTDELAGASGAALSRAVDRVLDLVARVRTPVHRESLLKDLAAKLALPVESVRDQFRLRLAGLDRTPPALPKVAPAPPPPRVDPREREAWSQIAGALLADASLVPLARARMRSCPDPDLQRILTAILELCADERAEVDAASVMNLLEDHPARDRVVPLLEWARRAESPRVLLEGQITFLDRQNSFLTRREVDGNGPEGGPVEIPLISSPERSSRPEEKPGIPA